MIERINKEWEITSTYIFNVISKKGVINLAWNDFCYMAREHKPITLVSVSNNQSLSNIVKVGLQELINDATLKITGIIVAIETAKGTELMMKEMQEVSACFTDMFNEMVNVIWGLQENEKLPMNDRSIMIFAFGEYQENESLGQ